jgi:hypothetical protein
MSATVCWSVKGGSGTTVVAACLALTNPVSQLLVDLDGDLPGALGLPEPAGQGLSDWFATDLPAASIEDLAVDLDATTRLIPRGSSPIPPASPRWDDLADWMRTTVFDVVVDAGAGALHPALHADRAGATLLLVTRACYLGLRRAASASPRPDGIVLVAEPGRSLQPRDVEHCIGAPVLATLDVDPAVARAVDAGLLLSRLPRVVGRSLRLPRPTAPVRP